MKIPTIYIDFDGVLFDSAPEVYSICQLISVKHAGYRTDIDYEEFLQFRRSVTDAWQFNRLYTTKRHRTVDTNFLLDAERLSVDDMAFEQQFFAMRQDLDSLSEGAEPTPYDFFHEIKSLLKNNACYFKIISTRNEKSIINILLKYEISEVEVIGRESLKAYSSKNAFMEKVASFNEGNSLNVFIDDMSEHLEGLESSIDLLIQPDWGYGISGKYASPLAVVVAIVRALCQQGCSE